MTFLPIVDRELRAAARRHSTYSQRVSIALLAIVLGLFIYAANRLGAKIILAQRTFQGLSALAILYCLAAGRRFTADCLSEEKRQGTLGLLFLTSLKGYDVVLGKLAATSLNGFYCLVAIFPVLAIPLLMGGVSNSEFWRMVILLLDTILLSLAIGVLASAISRESKRAMGANFSLLLLVTALLPACGGSIAYFSPGHTMVHWLFYSCPGYAFYWALDTNYPWRKWHFWLSILIIHAITWALVALASWLARTSWQDTPSGSLKRRWRDRFEFLIYGKGEVRRRYRTKLLDVNAFYWLTSRVRLKPVILWFALACIAGWWVFVSLQLGFYWADEFVGLAAFIMLNVLFKSWIAIESGQQLAEDQRSGALELLLSTPLTAGSIIHGQLLALKRLFLVPLVLAILTQGVLVYFAAHHSAKLDDRVRAFGATSIAMLLLDIAAVIGVGISNSLTAKSPTHAALFTVLKVLMLPWVAFAGIAVLVNIWTFARGGESPSWQFFLALWFLLGLATDLYFGIPGWWRTRMRFRELALQRLEHARKEPPQ
ncbi:MAG TPA: ABC transporter permease subunit [Candidatus Dormibacteraeota bacterium]|nr:ABC transporter permease subunit [Candidatus Dormibacteraeota bacterium]